MEGGLLIHAAWLLSFVFVWIYRRYFEAVGPRDDAFEQLCRRKPVLAAVHTAAGAEASVENTLRGSMPSREVIASFGGWPWIHYVLSVRICSARGVVRLTIDGCRRLRSHEARPVAVHALLAGLEAAHPQASLEVWLHPGAYFDVRGSARGDHGWRLASSTAGRLRFDACDGTPGWALPASPARRISDFARPELA